MSRSGGRTGSIAVALVAAWLLVLQSVLGAFASAAGPQPRQLDAFGNVICTHEGAAELPAGDPHQQSLPPCCGFGCLLSFAPLSSPPGALALSHDIVFEAAAFAAAAPAPPLFPRDRPGANPRAPPPVA